MAKKESKQEAAVVPSGPAIVYDLGSRTMVSWHPGFGDAEAAVGRLHEKESLSGAAREYAVVGVPR